MKKLHLRKWTYHIVFSDLQNVDRLINPHCNSKYYFAQGQEKENYVKQKVYNNHEGHPQSVGQVNFILGKNKFPYNDPKQASHLSFQVSI